MHPSENDLDRLIEEALKSEPLRPVPPGFQRRVEERVRVVAYASHERKGFHARLWASAFLFAMVGVTLVLIPALAFFQGWTVRALPGALGYMDYLSVFFVQSWAKLLVAALGSAGIVGLIAVLWALLPALRGKAARQQH